MEKKRKSEKNSPFKYLWKLHRKKIAINNINSSKEWKVMLE